MFTAIKGKTCTFFKNNAAWFISKYNLCSSLASLTVKEHAFTFKSSKPVPIWWAQVPPALPLKVVLEVFFLIRFQSSLPQIFPLCFHFPRNSLCLWICAHPPHAWMHTQNRPRQLNLHTWMSPYFPHVSAFVTKKPAAHSVPLRVFTLLSRTGETNK